MSKNKPVTIWNKYGVFETGKPTSVWKKTGVFEGDKPATEWKKYGVFESGKPASVWNKTSTFEGQKPASIWRETSGNYEYKATGLRYIVDTVGSFLVDPSGNHIIDTGVTMTKYPASVWAEDDSK